MKPITEQIILVTGATDGMGKLIAQTLAMQGATVLLHGRSQQRLDETVQEIRNSIGRGQLETYQADFSRLSDVRHLAQAIQEKHKQLDVLINNAGIGAGKRTDTERELSTDGYELRFAVNYLAPFLLTNLLLPCLRQAAPSRIVNVASIGQNPLDFNDVMLTHHYEPLQAYSQSKLALIMFTFDLAEALKSDHVTVNCLHPASLMNTKMVYETFGYTMSTVQDGTQAVLYLATSPQLEGVTGKYFDQQHETRANGQAYDQEARSQLRQLSEQWTGLLIHEA